jgi:predicted regulator of Ras-like GTPase activity (Roadblock/LC7/MglB family)
LEGVLRSLRDIDGVLGSFLLDERGQLLAQDMPGVFDRDTLTHASTRLSQLRAALESGAAATFEGCAARFGSHLLLLRAVHGRTLCVLCPVGTNLNTLQMGLNLVARRVAGEPSQSAAPPAPRASLPPAPPAQRASLPPPPRASQPPPEEPPQDPGSTTRFFRGRPVP